MTSLLLISQRPLLNSRDHPYYKPYDIYISISQHGSLLLQIYKRKRRNLLAKWSLIAYNKIMGVTKPQVSNIHLLRSKSRTQSSLGDLWIPDGRGHWRGVTLGSVCHKGQLDMRDSSSYNLKQAENSFWKFKNPFLELMELYPLHTTPASPGLSWVSRCYFKEKDCGRVFPLSSKTSLCSKSKRWPGWGFDPIAGSD